MGPSPPRDAAPTLVDAADNPAPPGTEASWVSAADGVRLRAFRCPPRPGMPSRGTVCLFPGRAEFLEKYLETAADLANRGFAVAALDWRGQGGSDRLLREPRKGHVASYAHFQRDLDAFLRQAVLPDCPQPVFALAHSMGALVVLRALAGAYPPFRRVVLSAPFLGLGSLYGAQPLVSLAANLVDALGFGRMFVPGGGSAAADDQPFAGNPLTTDPRRFARNAAVVAARPALALGAPTVRWVAASLRAIAEFTEAGVPERIATPVLILAAGADRIVSTAAATAVGRRLRLGRVIAIPNAQHELLQENDGVRAQLFAALDAFLPGS